jgi:hypothetical protein
MEIISGMEENWKKSTTLDPSIQREMPDEYYQAIIDMAKDWADEMERQMKGGEALADIWYSSRRNVEIYYELSGFQFNTAIALLDSFWVHGDELRVLHNKRHGYEGDGIVNTAIFTIEASSPEEAVEKIKEAAEKSSGRALTDEEMKGLLVGGEGE